MFYNDKNCGIPCAKRVSPLPPPLGSYGYFSQSEIRYLANRISIVEDGVSQSGRLPVEMIVLRPFAERINMIYSSSWMWDAACFGLIVDKRTMVTKHRTLVAFQLKHNNQRISAPRCKCSNPLQVLASNLSRSLLFQILCLRISISNIDLIN